MAVSQIQNASLASGVPGYANLPVGSVLQVVNATTSTETTNSTTTFADTTLTATITPKFSTSKILVLVNQSDVYAPSTAGNQIKLLRNSTIISTLALYAAYNGSTSMDIGSVSSCYLDSPATTSSTTYKTQFARATGSGTVYVQNGNSTSTITLMEIAG